MLPQGFMGALMATLVSSLIARKRIAAARVRFDGGRRLPLAIAAPLAGAAAAIVGFTLYALLMPSIVVALPAFPIAKALYGAALGGPITATALHVALGTDTSP